MRANPTAEPAAPRPRPVAGADAWDYLPLAAQAPSALAWRSGDLAFVALDLTPPRSPLAPHPWPLRFAGRTFTGAPGEGVWAGWPGAWEAAPRALYLSRRPGEVVCIGEARADRPPPSPSAPPLAPLHFTPATDRPTWEAAVGRATAAIRAGEASKIVLARREVARLPNAAAHVLPLLGQLRARHPGATTFGLNLGGDLGWFVGATPETLIAQEAGVVHTEALAGTSAAGPEALDNPKEREEHRWVVEGIAEALASVTQGLEMVGPQTKRAGHLLHWQTRLRAIPRPGVGLFDLAERIHPSPAVAGTPQDAALRFIAQSEPGDRGHYAGFLGWQDGRGDGHVVVGLRSALLRGDALHVFAGAGLVAASDPAAEWAETAAKLDACKHALAALAA